MTHIGTCIRKRLDEQRKTVVWLSRQLECSRTNVYKIFEKEHIDTLMLARIGELLDYNFFRILSDDFQESHPHNFPID